MATTYYRSQIATAVAVLFHAVGLAGILIFKSDAITRSTAINLLLCFSLLLWVQENKNIFFWLFAILTMVLGFAAELIGINTGILFGDYTYGEVLGLKWRGVPLVIAVNWFIVIYCCGNCVSALLEKIVHTTVPGTSDAAINPGQNATTLKNISVIVDGATLAVIFDWLIEPVAVKLGYWQWHHDDIPLYNYVCWFIISLLMMMLFRLLPFPKKNKFAIHLFLIQVMFFLLLRTFL